MFQIVAIEVTDYKRARSVAITPPADTHLVLLGGKNRQGKSSILDALTAAFGGAKQLADDPVRHGAKEASIFVKLADGDGGELTIDRTVDAETRKTTLEVRDAAGRVSKPQDMLDRLIGARFLDPLAFLQLSAKEQRATLMRVIPDAARIDELDRKRKAAFERRTEIGRKLTEATGALASMPMVAEVPTPIDVAALTAELSAITAHGRKVDDARSRYADAQRTTAGAISARVRNDDAIATAEQKIRELTDRLVELRALGDTITNDQRLSQEAEQTAKEAHAALLAAVDSDRFAAIQGQLATADAHNKGVYEATSLEKRREETAAALVKLKADDAACTKALTTIDTRKAEILAAAKLPVEGLAITDDGIELAGVPLSQASGAEKMRVALDIALRASPGLADVWVRDAALLDDESLAAVAAQAEAAGKRVWLERVGTRDPGVIEIRDGMVAS